MTKLTYIIGNIETTSYKVAKEISIKTGQPLRTKYTSIPDSGLLNKKNKEG